MQKTLTLRIEKDDYDFVKKLAKDRNEDVSKVVRQLVDFGRIMLAIEQYKQKKVSFGTAANLAGISIGEFMELLSELNVKSNLTYGDYVQGFKNLKEVW